MPPARPRVIDDARSETSTTNMKDRAVSNAMTSKSKKTNVNSSGNMNTGSKLSNGLSNVSSAAATNGAGHLLQEPPHVDWTSFPLNALHSYRSAYRLQIPSAYTQSHADLLYRSCDIAFQAPSQMLAKKRSYDLKQYRKRQTQQERAQTNGVSKPSKYKLKDGRRNITKRKENLVDSDAGPHLSIEEPPSPKSNSHPSLQDSASNPPDNASHQSPTMSIDNDAAPPDEDLNSIPLSLNQQDPESTTIGSLSPTSLSTSIRKHFNAQQVNEAETVARFSYVVRQQGSLSMSRVQPLAQRGDTLVLPNTTAENIAATADAAAATSLATSALTTSSFVPAGTFVAVAPTTNAAPTKANAHNSHTISTTRTLGGQPIEVEGAFGDGRGWIMGTTSCGRQIRIQDGGGTGAFRLRFTP